MKGTVRSARTRKGLEISIVLSCCGSTLERNEADRIHRHVYMYLYIYSYVLFFLFYQLLFHLTLPWSFYREQICHHYHHFAAYFRTSQICKEKKN